VSKNEATIAANLGGVCGAIATAAKTVDRNPDDVKLIAVSKMHLAETIKDALNSGQRVFGENRIQETQEKWPGLKEAFPDVELHLIGGLQTNKVRAALDLFDVIHTVDRLKLAMAIALEADRRGKLPTCFVQINTGEEAQKGGVMPLEADAFVATCRDELGLPLAGLMCIPPVDEEPSLHFALLKKIAKRNGIEGLSMGMSHDFELAVKMGATHTRVGTAIFGPRASSLDNSDNC